LQVVLAHAAEFLEANASSLDLTQSSPKYAFKWLQLADAACLKHACKAVADRIIQLDRSSCVTDNTKGLSPQTLTYLLDKCATAVPQYAYLGSSTASFGAAGSYLGALQDIYGIGAAAGYGGCYSCARIRARDRYTPGGVRLAQMCRECGREI
jgi:hypothetical protein